MSEKERFALRLPTELLESLEQEAKAKDTSVTQLIEAAVRNRTKVASIDTMEDHFVKALGLCPECREMYRAWAQTTKYLPRKLVREIFWRWIGVWPHGQYEDGCPGADQEVSPEELRKIQDKLAEGILNASV